MLCSVVFKCADGDTEVFANEADLDYYNIRHWRALYLRFYHFQNEHSDLCELVIKPLYNLPF